MSDTWEVIMADPEGYWLVLVGSKDPTEWAWMEQGDPAEEIERLREEIASWNAGCEAAREILGAREHETLLDVASRTKRSIKELENERDEAIAANHSVSVCANHTSEIINFDGCLVCEIERLRERVEELENMGMVAGAAAPARDPRTIGGAGGSIPPHSHIITHEQINAARDRLKHLHRAANDQNVPGKIRQRFEAAAHAIKTALKEDFNIVIGGEDE